ncbi:MAG: hypothetical protein KIT15_15225 [Xanthobacteraceae bacterium]|nr:hypothetical protein [Xanthobacteraceae bacterium]MCW5679423.1 hypothetical protein [Xanthobacteraceae bacterium]
MTVRPIDHILEHCGSLHAKDRVAILFDEQTKDIAKMFHNRALEITNKVTLLEVPAANMHGTEPPDFVAQSMLEQDLIVGLTYTSLAHTRARNNASENGARYLSLPEYSAALLRDPSVLVDYRSISPKVRALADAFTQGTHARVLTDSGTDIKLNIRGRTGNYCPGTVVEPGSLGSPPDIEANVSPIETESEGIIVVDGSIPCKQIGLLKVPVSLHVSKGRITKFNCQDHELLETLEGIFAAVSSPKAYILAECGVGLNPEARLTGIMLTDEGAQGCIHFGFGSNATVGGLNDVPFHLDFVCRHAKLEIDGKSIMNDGVWSL